MFHPPPFASSCSFAMGCKYIPRVAAASVIRTCAYNSVKLGMASLASYYSREFFKLNSKRRDEKKFHALSCRLRSALCIKTKQANFGSSGFHKNAFLRRRRTPPPRASILCTGVVVRGWGGGGVPPDSSDKQGER